MRYNAELLYLVHKFTLPAALSLLPGKMNSPEARAMVLAIGLQESRFIHRVQVKGPAHGFWQFESGGGIKGVLSHPSTQPVIRPILATLGYKPVVSVCYAAVIHNDILAATFARLLLWTVPGRLPQKDQMLRGWQQYLDGWRPGKPHFDTWADCFDEAWRTVIQE